MVTAVTYSTFRNNLKSYLRKVNEDADTLLVTNTDPADDVVVIGKDDYESLMETMRIYNNPYLRDKIDRGWLRPAPDASSTTTRPQRKRDDAELDRGCMERLSLLAKPDRKTLKRINALIRDMKRSPFEGIGKPEPLKWDYQGAWSRRIDSANRIVYTVIGDDLCILSCRDHYE